MNENADIPHLHQVVSILGDFLRERGAAYGARALGCFGSVARREATADSDVDVVYVAEPSARHTLFDLAMLRDELVARLGRPVDLVEFREEMSPGLKQRVQREVVYA